MQENALNTIKKGDPKAPTLFRTLLYGYTLYIIRIKYICQIFITIY